jgi:hypothetical protein
MHTKKRRIVTAVGAFALALAFAAPASAIRIREPRCGPNQTLVSVEQKVCPATPRRGAVIFERACCMTNRGTMRCDHFQHCPKRSPS